MISVLEVNSVRKEFNSRQVLTDIYLKCQTGDILGILGRNGTGKSTLLKIIFGTLNTDNKCIRIDGKVYEHAYRTSNNIAYLPQHGFIPGHLSIFKVLNLFLPDPVIKTFLTDPLLAELKNKKVADLSGGELRYFETKLLLFTESKFVLMDEPFTGLSPLLIDEIKIIIQKQSQSKGIIITDHDYRNVMSVANRFYVLFDGGIKEVKDVNDLIKWGYISKA